MHNDQIISKCPLCHAELPHSAAATCVACSAPSDPGPGGEAQREAPKGRASVSERARIRSPEDGEPYTAVQKVGLGIWGLTLVSATIAVALRSGGEAALVTCIGLLCGSGIFRLLWRGFTTGHVNAISYRHSKRIYAYAEQPILFVFSLVYWAVVGVAFAGAALDPSFALGLIGR